MIPPYYHFVVITRYEINRIRDDAILGDFSEWGGFPVDRVVVFDSIIFIREKTRSQVYALPKKYVIFNALFRKLGYVSMSICFEQKVIESPTKAWNNNNKTVQ